ncbi:MAG: hypothetical protein ABIH71_07690 [Candidatus Omnitrophota bacterium]
MEQRKNNKCPRCLGELKNPINKDGIIMCVDCDFEQPERRRKEIPEGLNDWVIKGGG